MSGIWSKIHCGRKYQIDLVKHCIRYYLKNWSQHTLGTLRKALPCAVNPLLDTIKQTCRPFRSTVPLHYVLFRSTISCHFIITTKSYWSTDPTLSVISIASILVTVVIPFKTQCYKDCVTSDHILCAKVTHTFPTFRKVGWPESRRHICRLICCCHDVKMREL